MWRWRRSGPAQGRDRAWRGDGGQACGGRVTWAAARSCAAADIAGSGRTELPIDSDQFKVKGRARTGQTVATRWAAAFWAPSLGARWAAAWAAPSAQELAWQRALALRRLLSGPNVWIPAEALVTFHLNTPLTVNPVNAQESGAAGAGALFWRAEPLPARVLWRQPLLSRALLHTGYGQCTTGPLLHGGRVVLLAVGVTVGILGRASGDRVPVLFLALILGSAGRVRAAPPGLGSCSCRCPRVLSASRTPPGLFSLGPSGTKWGRLSGTIGTENPSFGGSGLYNGSESRQSIIARPWAGISRCRGRTDTGCLGLQGREQGTMGRA